MAYQLKSKKGVRKGVRRMVRRDVEKALQALKSRKVGDEVVHNVRKRFKKVRAILRLVSDKLGKKVYRRENKCFRDAGRPLAEIRDARVLIDSLDQLVKHFAERVSDGMFDEVRTSLTAHHQEIRRDVLREQNAIAGIIEAIESAQGRIKKWQITHTSWLALSRGLKQVYKQGGNALSNVTANASVENLHEWRKQAKYLWYELQVVEAFWPNLLNELRNDVHDLTERLGDDHDLAVLRQTILDDPDRYGGDSTLETLLALIDRRREELQQEAFPLGRRLYADKPQVFLDRISEYWKTWRSESKVDESVQAKKDARQLNGIQVRSLSSNRLARRKDESK